MNQMELLMKKIIEYLSDLKHKCISSDEEAMARFGITHSEYQFFQAVDKCENLNSMELSRHTGLSPSRTSRIIELLVKHDFLIRETSNEDRRAIVLTLTDKGKKTAGAIRDFKAECEMKFSTSLSGKEIEEIKKSLDKILTIL